MRHPIKVSQAGFTLLEVMVVLVIIALMISMVGLAPGGNEQENEAELLALKMKSQLQAFRDDAVFYNRDLGLAMDGDNILLLEYYDIQDPVVSRNLNKKELAQYKENPWGDYTGTLQGEIEVEFEEGADNFFFTAEIDGEEQDFAEYQDEKDGPKPLMGFMPSDEYTPFKITLSHHHNESFQIEISGDGLGKVKTKKVRYED